MKTNFTLKFIRHLALAAILAHLCLILPAQTTHNVAVTNDLFTPSQLTITAGDKVIWQNSAGSHNVNGTKTTFPSNPESFGNNVGSTWTYEFTFNTAGTYDYQCDPHASMGMTGRVVVNPKVPTSSQELADAGDNIQLFPNPARQHIELRLPRNFEPIRSIKVYSIAGILMEEMAFTGNKESLRYDVSSYRNGMYFMEINAGNKKNVLKFLKQ
jgi:plastocyanin